MGKSTTETRGPATDNGTSTAITQTLGPSAVGVRPSREDRQQHLADNDLLSPGNMVGRYVILEKIGSGGMGEVYKAYDPELDRKVAIKVVSVSPSKEGEGTEAAARLIREAKSLAQLSHPNVVSVFDVGAYGRDVFIAMEFVEGETLRSWSRGKQRSPAEVVNVFVQAGRGLAAAHRAGIVHRDFKPDNVLIGGDGRVQVVDFGIALAEEPLPQTSTDGSSGADWKTADTRPLAGIQPVSNTAETRPMARLQSLSHTGNPSVSAPLSALDRLTKVGAMVGTPAYMSPEQFLNEAVDAKSDQFCFCIALYEALYGQRPFPGKGVTALRRNVVTGTMRDPGKSGRRVPARLRRIVERGLSVPSEDRYPGMEELLADLSVDPRARLRRVIGVGAVAAAVALGVAMPLLGQGSEARLCEMAQTELAGHWDDAVRAGAEAAFARTNKPYAADVFQRVGTLMDRYAHDWVDARTATCRATHVLGTQSAAMLDLRMNCLNQRRDALSSLAGVLSGDMDADTMDKAVPAVIGLPKIDDCADDEALTAAVPPPSDPARRAAVDSLRSRLSVARALQTIGNYRGGLAIIAEVQSAVDDTDYAPLQAEMHLLEGKLEHGNGNAQAASDALRTAVLFGARARDDRLVADAWTDYLLAAEARGEYAHGLEWYAVAEAAVARAGDDPVQRGVLLQAAGALHSALGNYATAVDYQEEALELIESALGADDALVAEALNDLSNTYYRHNRKEEALALDERTMRIREKVYGERHPLVAVSVYNLATLAAGDRDYERAEAMFTRALALFREAHGEEHPHTAAAYHALGSLHMQHGHPGKAEHFARRSLELREKSEDPNHPSIASSLTLLGGALEDLGKFDEAEQLLLRALAAAETKLGPEHTEVAATLVKLGGVYVGMGQLARARPLYERALKINRAVFGEGHRVVGGTHRVFAEALAIAGKYREAGEQYERALEIFDQSPSSVYRPSLAWIGLAEIQLELGQPKKAQASLARYARDYRHRNKDDYLNAVAAFASARVRWSEGARGEAVDLAREARAMLAGQTRRGAADYRERIDAWLEEHEPKARRAVSALDRP